MATYRALHGCQVVVESVSNPINTAFSGLPDGISLDKTGNRHPPV